MCKLSGSVKLGWLTPKVEGEGEGEDKAENNNSGCV